MSTAPKLIAIIQFFLIILILLLTYGVKIYLYYDEQRRQRLQKEIHQTLKDWVEKSEPLKKKDIRLFKRYPTILMESMLSLDTSINHPQWEKKHQEIIDLILLPSARIYAKSSLWARRHIACQFFALSLKKEDAKFLILLIKDPIPLVSVTSAKIALKLNTQEIIDTIIDIFSKGRRIQHTFYSQIMSTADPEVSSFIKNRIQREKNPYIKAFCYRTLMSFPPGMAINTINEDLHFSNIELKISSLAYLVYSSPQIAAPICIDFLNNERWEVRAKSAQFLGKIGDTSVAHLLEVNLRDPEWWVRINTAEALALLGKEGLDILKRQKSFDNQEAFEVAKQILSTKN